MVTISPSRLRPAIQKALSGPRSLEAGSNIGIMGYHVSVCDLLNAINASKSRSMDRQTPRVRASRSPCRINREMIAWGP